MNAIWDWLKSGWTQIAWLVAAIIVMIDPQHIYEWAHKHEVWGGVIAAIFTVILAWAQRQKQQQSPSETQAQIENQRRAQ